MINQKQFNEDGFLLVNEIFSASEIEAIIDCIESKNTSSSSFLVSKNLFAIRQLLNVIPELTELIITPKIKNILDSVFQDTYFLTKGMYFDKPKKSNWFVGYHQDLIISVEKKHPTKGYKNWTFKKNQFGVQPPSKILNNTVTLRIHLDKTNRTNGALKVLSKTHKKGVLRVNSTFIKTKKETICEIEKGGIMLMKPLLLHASNRSTTSTQRRVIHLEFNTLQLESPLNWLEYLEIH